MTDPVKERNEQATDSGPSWLLMLFFIFLAMLIAIGVAWAFIHPMLHPR